MKTFKTISLLICTTLIFFISAAPVVKILQNGLDSYQGCDDAYIYYNRDLPTDANFGTCDSLLISIEDT